MLTLFEELFLLTLDDEKGNVIAETRVGLGYGMAGAILAELAILGKLQVNKDHRIEILDSTETGDDILDSSILELRASERLRKTPYWVETLAARPKKSRTQVGDQLVSKGMLTREGGHLQWVVPSPLYPQFDAPAKYQIKNRLREIVLACGEADLRSLALLSLLQATKLLKLVFTKDERRVARRHIYEKVVGEALGDPVAQTIEEIQEAVATALADGAS